MYKEASMSLFNKIFDTPSIDVAADAIDHDLSSASVEAVHTEPKNFVDVSPEKTPDNQFTNYIKGLIRFGAATDSSPEPELVHEEPNTPQEDVDSPSNDEPPTVEPTRLDGDVCKVVAAESVERAPDLKQESQLVPALPASKPAMTVVRATSMDQKSDVQVERIVDGLFDRMRVVWGNEDRQVSSPQVPAPRKASPAQAQHYALAESRADFANLIRTEVPRAIKGELISVLQTEIMKSIRSEISRVVRDEFVEFGRMMAKHLERLHAIEARMAKIEGAVGREVEVNFPEGAVQVNVPITIPEREVKIAAPINVQPPSITFDEGAISVHFNKTADGKKEVRFERDPHDQSIKSAEIINVQPQPKTEHYVNAE